MPGFFGTTYAAEEEQSARNDLRKMGELVTHADFYVKEQDDVRSGVACSRVHFGKTHTVLAQVPDCPVTVWIEGEIYNAEWLARKYKIAAHGSEEIAAELYRMQYEPEGGWGFLKELSGDFALFIFDRPRQILHLITDRLGSKPIFYFLDDANFAWAHEVKAFLGLKRFKPEISPDSVDEFISQGYLANNKTWFKNVRRLPGSRVMSFDIATSKLSELKYWNWGDVTPIADSSNADEIAEELARRLKAAVCARLGDDLRIGVPLSGGLDSRVILASVPGERLSQITAYTFGVPGCDEISIAGAVAAKMRANHLVFELNEKNWIEPRIRGVWIADGLLDMLHMHGVEFVDDMKACADIILSGILGGGLIGGLLLKEKASSEVDILENRIAGRSTIGTTLEAFMIEQRLPFFDNELNEFIFSIPGSLRANAKIYHRMLLTYYPDYFRTIADANTGCPISYPSFVVSQANLLRRVRRGIYKKFSFPSKAPSSMMHDYKLWIKMQPARKIFQDTLLSGEALYPAFVSMDVCRSKLESHMDGTGDHSAYLCRMLTLEFWLQQVYAGKYRGGVQG